jgi:hypothetical protein
MRVLEGIMLRGVGLLVLFGLITAGCAATGHYTGSGPCRGWKTDLATCERAAETWNLRQTFASAKQRKRSVE